MAQVFPFFWEICFGCVILHDFPFFFSGTLFFVKSSQVQILFHTSGFWAFGLLAVQRTSKVSNTRCRVFSLMPYSNPTNQ